MHATVSHFRTFTVPGQPMGAPRMTRRDKWDKRPVVVRYFAYRDLIVLHFRAAGGHPQGFGKTLIVESLSWSAFFVPPKSWSTNKRQAAIGCTHRSTPDRDNIDKTILDALFPHHAGGDSSVACGQFDKVWSDEPRLEITITYCEPESYLAMP